MRLQTPLAVSVIKVQHQSGKAKVCFSHIMQLYTSMLSGNINEGTSHDADSYPVLGMRLH